MNLADTLRGLARRWYIVLPGVILSIVLAGAAYFVVQPGYERTATQLLIPGSGTIPEGTSNPYLFLGGLTPAADILVRALNSDDGVGAVVTEYPGTEIEVTRDATIAGPVVAIVVTAGSDADAAGAVEAMLTTSEALLVRLQDEQNVSSADRIGISTLTQDEKSTLQQRGRLLAAAGVGFGAVILTLLLASLVDGLARRAHRTGRRGVAGPAVLEDDRDSDPVPEQDRASDSDGEARPDVAETVEAGSEPVEPDTGDAVEPPRADLDAAVAEDPPSGPTAKGAAPRKHRTRKVLVPPE